MRGRAPIARIVAALAVVLLGAVAGLRLPLSGRPETALPELTVILSLPSRTDPADVTRRWVVSLESAIRAVGDVQATSGRVSSSSAWITVRLDARTDPFVKSARLASDLAALRSTLPEGGRLEVWPATEGAGDRAALLLLAGRGAPSGAERIADGIRSLPGVRDVDVYGGVGGETWVRMASDPAVNPGLLAESRDALRRAGETSRLGETRVGGRELPVVSRDAPGRDLARLPIRAGGKALPLGSIAALTRRVVEPRRVFRSMSRPAVGLAVLRQPGTSLLALDTSLRSYAAEVARLSGGRFALMVVDSEGEPLRRLLLHLVAGSTAAALIAGLAGWWLGGWLTGLLAAGLVPAGVAAALNAYWLAGVSLDVMSLRALALALACALPPAFLRAGAGLSISRGAAMLWALTVLLLPAAVFLGKGVLRPDLGEAARAFTVAALAVTVVVLLIPRRIRPCRSPRWLARRQALWMRDPLSVLLIVGTGLAVSFSFLGGSLDPRRRAERSSEEDLAVRLSLPEGATLDRTITAVSEAEELLNKAPEIEGFWSLIEPGKGLIRADIKPGARNPERVSLLKTRLGYQLRRLRAAVRTETGGDDTGHETVFSSDRGEERARTDDEATFYRFILRSTDLSVLRTGQDMVMSRMGRLGIRYDNVETGWGAPSLRLELDPEPSVTPGELTATAATLREATTVPHLLSPSAEPDRRIVFQPPGAPGGDDAVPQRAALLRLAGPGGRAPIAERFRPALRSVYPSVRRESGRFVLPVTVEFRFNSPQARKDQRKALHQSLESIHLPAGCDLERPSLDRYHVAPVTLRLYAIAALVPLCLFAASAIWLDSLVMALVALLPGAAGLAATAPLLWLTGQVVDERALISLAAVLFGAAPWGILFLSDCLRRSQSVPASRAVHRTAQSMLAAAASAVLFIVVILAGTTLATDGGEAPWVPSLRAAALCGGTEVAVSFLVLPSAALAILDARRRRARRKQRHIRRPPAWIDDRDPLSLTVRRLTKIFPGGTRALTGVDFDLGAGVVGLLGPNGAGKTTLLRLLTGLLEPTRGRILFKGIPLSPENLPAFRPHIGFLPQEFNAYPGFTAEEFLDYWALQRGMDGQADRQREIEHVLSTLGLEGEARRRMRQLSGGQRRRIGIARALLGAPDILIVDEPTTGLDASGRSVLRQLLAELGSERIVILSTHIASDVTVAASRVLLLHRGRLRLDASPSELIERARGRVFEAVVPDWRIRSFCKEYEVTARVRVRRGLQIRALAAPGRGLDGALVEPTLEEAYLLEIRRADPRAPGTELGLRELLWPRPPAIDTPILG